MKQNQSLIYFKYRIEMKTIEKIIKETITGKHDLPVIVEENKDIVQVSIKIYNELRAWHWVHRDNLRLNNEIKKIRHQFKQNQNDN